MSGRSGGSGDDVQLCFRVRSTLGAGPGVQPDGEEEGGGEREADPYGPDSAFAREMRARVRRLELETRGLSFEPRSTMGAGPGSTDHLA